jgi:N-glycosylase/DNA lyase
MKMILDSAVTPFNLDYTLQCGQVFRWQKHHQWWQGIVADRVIRMRQMENAVEFEGADAEFVKEYFRLNDPLPLIVAEIAKDDHMKSAVNAFHGLRLIRQDPWECLISYICATFSNIPRIKRMIENLAQNFGNEQTMGSVSYFTFPSPENLANANPKDLAACKLGFRAKNVLEAAKRIDAESIRLSELRRLDYREAKNELLRLPGVGDKVADCILLFSLDKLESFPVDVWMKKAVLKHYSSFFAKSFIQKMQKRKSLTRKEYEQISSFARSYFGNYAGFAQQYLYHFERVH